METIQKRKILKRIVAIQAEMEQLKDVKMKLATSEYASASMSSGGGSKSYTRADIGKVEQALRLLTSELKELRKLLSGIPNGHPSKILTVYI